ncbi:hypothetical protein Y1Q_0008501 [Alligator mississippiensis]|uniref:Uncharacterized protein n=1 Tax=Alligator mississippiensis TaxID=8496 RepID=A0A151M1I3_ALLMI|nr:hypothetical protein Y1Q_0008501 [Alligator mississippiensis]
MNFVSSSIASTHLPRFSFSQTTRPKIGVTSQVADKLLLLSGLSSEYKMGECCHLAGRNRNPRAPATLRGVVSGSCAVDRYRPQLARLLIICISFPKTPKMDSQLPVWTFSMASGDAVRMSAICSRSKEMLSTGRTAISSHSQGCKHRRGVSNKHAKRGILCFLPMCRARSQRLHALAGPRAHTSSQSLTLYSATATCTLSGQTAPSAMQFHPPIREVAPGRSQGGFLLLSSQDQELHVEETQQPPAKIGFKDATTISSFSW